MYNLCSRQTYICLCDFLRVMVKSAFFPREMGKNHNLVSVKRAVKLKNHQHHLSVGIYDFFFLLYFSDLSFTNSSYKREASEYKLYYYIRSWGFHRLFHIYWGFPGSTNGKEPTCWCKRLKRHGSDPWVKKIPWRRAWQSTPIFLPGESHEQRRLEGYGPWGLTESDMTEET